LHVRINRMICLDVPKIENETRISVLRLRGVNLNIIGLLIGLFI